MRNTHAAKTPLGHAGRLRPIAAAFIILVIQLRQPRAEAGEATLWAESCLAKVLRNAQPSRGASIDLSGAREEIVSGQAVFLATQDIPSAVCAVTDLVRAGATDRIPATAIKLQWVRYIDLTHNSPGVPQDELVARAPVSMPDAYWEDAAIPITANQAQPIWVECHVPPEAAAGDYTGELRVSGADRPVELPIKLHVWNFSVPRERHLSVINWWRFPGPGFEGRVKRDSEEYWRLLARFCEFLVEHRQTDISASLEAVKRTENDEHDYTDHIERYAEVAFSAGIRQIHLHSVGKRTGEILNPSSRVIVDEEKLNRLQAIEKIAERRSWKQRFAVSICDEPFVHHEESYAAVVDRVHQAAPQIRCLEAVEAEYLGKLDVYVPKLNHLDLWYPQYDEARRQGAELWFYICNHPMGRYPNRWVDQPLLKVRVLHWLNYLYDLKGYLHWALNQVKDKNYYSEQGIGGEFAPGERAIVYPGRDNLLGSLRFSAQRDGLQDYEYLWVLEDKLRQLKAKIGEREAYWLDPRQRSLELCRRVIWSFHDYTRDAKMMLDTRQAVAEEIESLETAPLLMVQTSPPENTMVPSGPRHVTVRGIVAPGAKLTINGKRVVDVRPSGYFTSVQFLKDDQPAVTVTVEQDGRTRTAVRKFRLTD